MAMPNTHVRYAATVPVQDGHIVCGAATVERTERIARQLQQCLAPADTYCIAPVTDLLESAPLAADAAYREQFRQPHAASHWHILRGTTQMDGASVIDWWSFTSERTRQTVATTLFDAFRVTGAATHIDERGDVPFALEQAFPLLGRHGLHHLVGDLIWDHITTGERHVLSSDSRGALENGKNGERFETVFKQLCDRSGLSWYKPAARAFARHLPEAYIAVRDACNGTAGIPDFFVDKENTDTLQPWMTTLPERSWEPDSRYAFVECKYNNSALSSRQRDMVAALVSHDLEVYVMRGTPQDYWFERI